MELSLGFSPCPNDTFIFDALVNKRIDTQGIDFTIHLEDVQTLNQWAIEKKFDISKISYGVLPLVLKDYILLKSGSALGSGVGPLLIARHNISPDDLENYQIAIPGENTTAHLLFKLAFPNVINKIFLRYDEIEDFVLNNTEKSAGVIIHENRFTYQDRGLVKIIDLGDFWEKTTAAPIPLGGIIAKRELDQQLLIKIDSLIKQSIEFAYSNYPQLTDFIRSNAQEMSEEVMRKHIDLYVNDFSIDLGDKGKKAINTLLDAAGLDKQEREKIFL